MSKIRIDVDEDGVTKHARLSRTDELLPCAFCGDIEISLENTHTASYWLECQRCGAQVNGESEPGNSILDHECAAFSAIEKWNSRKPECEFLKQLKSLPFFEFVIQVKEREEKLSELLVF